VPCLGLAFDAVFRETGITQHVVVNGVEAGLVIYPFCYLSDYSAIRKFRNFRLPKSGNRKEMTSIVLRLKSHLLSISYVVR